MYYVKTRRKAKAVNMSGAVPMTATQRSTWSVRSLARAQRLARIFADNDLLA